MTAATVYEFVRQRRHGPEDSVCRCGCLERPESMEAAEHSAAHAAFAVWLGERDPADRIFIAPDPAEMVRMVAEEHDVTCYGKCQRDDHAGMPAHSSEH